MSEISRVNSVNKRYGQWGRKSSSSDVEQSLPLSNSLISPSGSRDCEVTDITEKRANGVMADSEKANGNGYVSSDVFEMKINVVNIECTSRDGMSRNTTSLDIQTLKNGCTISTENILNNNINDSEANADGAEDEIGFIDDQSV